MDTALPQKLPFILDGNLAKALTAQKIRFARPVI